MKILNISDLRFPSILSNKNKRFIDAYFKKPANELSNLTNLIKKEKVELVLIAGDIMGDVSGDSYSNILIWLLDYLENNKIYCYFVSGNHDIDKSYSEIVNSLVNYKYVKEISGQLVNHNNLKIFGLSYFHTENLTGLKSLISQKSEQIDILLCHSQNKRIPFLFDFQSRYIVTGHFDLIFGNIFNQIIIAINLGCFAIIETSENKNVIKYYKPNIFYSFFSDLNQTYSCKIINENISFSDMLNENYVHDLAILRAIKTADQIGQLTNEIKANYLNRKGLPKISHSTQISFLGKQLFNKINS